MMDYAKRILECRNLLGTNGARARRDEQSGAAAGDHIEPLPSIAPVNVGSQRDAVRVDAE
jgi:hypothetical protein